MAVTAYYSIKLLNELCDELGIDPDRTAASITLEVNLEEVPRLTVRHVVDVDKWRTAKEVLRRYALVPIEDRTDAVV